MAITLSYPGGGALIVGGTGRVGEGIVRQMAAAGVPLVFTYRGGAGRDGETRSLQLKQELCAAGHSVRRRRVDLGDEGSVQSAIDEVVAWTGRLHTVICAAGPVTPFRRMVDFGQEEVETFYAGDIFAYFRLYRLAVKTMRQSGGGSITGTTTMANWRAVDYDGISATSKAAIDSLTRQIAAEEAGLGIRCNAVAIGWVDPIPMDQVKAYLATVPPASGPAQTDQQMLDALLAQLVERTRLPRNARPEEAGNLFAFLASEQAAYLTGQTIVFDGGTTL